MVDEQAALIAGLEAELAQLRTRLAELEPTKLETTEGSLPTSKPNASRRKTSEDTRAAIRTDLAAGLSQREAAERNGVSVMTISRVARGV